MAIQYGHGRLVTTGLIYSIDAGDKNSYSGTGTTWADTSGYGRNGTLFNGTAFNPANSGTMVFDGTDDYVEVPNELSFFNNNNFTLSFFVKRGNTSSSGAPISGVLGPGARDLFNIGFNSVYTSINNIQLLYFNWYGEADSWSLETNLNDTNWHQIVVTGDRRTFTLYKDGTSAASTTNRIIPRDIPTFRIGYASGAGGNAWGFFNGNLSNVQIYNRTLSTTEIAQNFTIQRKRYNI